MKPIIATLIITFLIILAREMDEYFDRYNKKRKR